MKKKIKEQIDGWLNGCCYLPNLKRVMITAERSLSIWDFRNNKQSKNNNNMVLFKIILLTRTFTTFFEKY